MKYLENLELLRKEILEYEEYALYINYHYFYIEPSQINCDAILTLLNDEISEIETISDYGFDNYKILEFKSNIPKPKNYKNNLLNLYKEILLMDKMVKETLIENNGDYEPQFNLKVIVNSKIYNIEFINTDLIKELLKTISEDYLSDKEIKKLELQYA